MRILIETIPHEQQRYPTVGDWFYVEAANGEKALVIRVSELGDEREEVLVAIHELIEVVLCKHQGVTQEAVDKFDIQFENARPEGNLDEPGDDPQAPYKKQHCLATGIERLLAAMLDVDWKTYSDKVEKL